VGFFVLELSLNKSLGQWGRSREMISESTEAIFVSFVSDVDGNAFGRHIRISSSDPHAPSVVFAASGAFCVSTLGTPSSLKADEGSDFLLLLVVTGDIVVSVSLLAKFKVLFNDWDDWSWSPASAACSNGNTTQEPSCFLAAVACNSPETSQANGAAKSLLLNPDSDGLPTDSSLFVTVVIAAVDEASNDSTWPELLGNSLSSEDLGDRSSSKASTSKRDWGGPPAGDLNWSWEWGRGFERPAVVVVTSGGASWSVELTAVLLLLNLNLLYSYLLLLLSPWQRDQGLLGCTVGDGWCWPNRASDAESPDELALLPVDDLLLLLLDERSWPSG
jgi:hypothetical protein